jgi:uncharacterized protein (DUF2384 family)
LQGINDPSAFDAVSSSLEAPVWPFASDNRSRCKVLHSSFRRAALPASRRETAAAGVTIAGARPSTRRRNPMFTYERRQKNDTASVGKPNGSERLAMVAQYREKTVDALHSGADTARMMARRASKAVRRTGDRLDHAADYIESYDVSRAPSDMGRWLQRHPVPILAVTAVAGFFLARSLRRSH